MTGTDENVDPGAEPAVEPEPAAIDLADAAAGPRRHIPATWRVATALGVLLIASAGLASWLYFVQYRTDQQVSPAAEQAALTAAADGAVAVLTYAPETLDADFSSAKSHLTGDFLSYYTDFTRDVVSPAAKQKQVQTSAAVVRKGIVDIRPTSATVLVFLNQTTVSEANPDGSFSMSSVKIGLEKHDGRWLISSFDPV